MAVQFNYSCSWIIKSEYKVKDCCFSHSTFANDCDKSIRLNGEIEIIEDIIGLVDVLKGDIFEGNMPLNICQVLRTLSNISRCEHHGCDLLDIN